MNPTDTKNGLPIAFINVKFYVCALHIEIAIVSLLAKGGSTRKSDVKIELVNLFQSGGADGATDWVGEDDYVKHIRRARILSQCLYPKFYK